MNAKHAGKMEASVGSKAMASVIKTVEELKALREVNGISLAGTACCCPRRPSLSHQPSEIRVITNTLSEIQRRASPDPSRVGGGLSVSGFLAPGQMFLDCVLEDWKTYVILWFCEVFRVPGLLARPAHFIPS